MEAPTGGSAPEDTVSRWLAGPENAILPGSAAVEPSGWEELAGPQAGGWEELAGSQADGWEELTVPQADGWEGPAVGGEDLAGSQSGGWEELAGTPGRQDGGWVEVVVPDRDDGPRAGHRVAGGGPGGGNGVPPGNQGTGDPKEVAAPRQGDAVPDARQTRGDGPPGPVDVAGALRTAHPPASALADRCTFKWDPDRRKVTVEVPVEHSAVLRNRNVTKAIRTLLRDHGWEQVAWRKVG